MQAVIDSLADQVHAAMVQRRSSNPSTKLLIGIAGVPGAGKSTVAAALAHAVNQRAASTSAAVLVSMDGFHLYRRELDAMPHPRHAHVRRGAIFTFNAAKFLAMLKSVLPRDAAGTAPSFDHGVGDPVESDVVIPASAEVLIVEGNYLLVHDHEQPAAWAEIRGLFHQRVFLRVPLCQAMERVRLRHIGTGHSAAAAMGRIIDNDLINARYIERVSITPDVRIIDSVHDPPCPS